MEETRGEKKKKKKKRGRCTWKGTAHGTVRRQKAERQTRVRCTKERQESHVCAFSISNFHVTPGRRRLAEIHESRISITFSNATVTPIAVIPLFMALPTDCHTGTLQENTVSNTPTIFASTRVIQFFALNLPGIQA